LEIEVHTAEPLVPGPSLFEDEIAMVKLKLYKLPKRDEATGGWRKMHNEELHNLYFLPSMIRIINSKRVRWTGHVAQMEKRNAYRLLVGKSEGKKKDQDVDGWIILRWILERQDGTVSTGLVWLRIGTRGGLLLMR
jgi:hypothetical protein